MDMIDDKRSARRWAFLLWAAMDAAQILVYTLSALLQGRTPYVDDACGSLGVLDSHGYAALLALVPSWAMQASLFFSCALLLWGNRSGVYIACAQVPLRLILLMPSVPLALTPVRQLDIAPTVLLLLCGGMLLFIEWLKFWTLRKDSRLPAPVGELAAQVSGRNR